MSQEIIESLEKQIAQLKEQMGNKSEESGELPDVVKAKYERLLSQKDD